MSSFSFSYAHKSTIVHDIYCPDDNIAKIQIKYWQDLINIGIDKTPKSRKSVLLDRGIALGQGVQHPNSNTMLCILHTFNANELKFIKRRILTWIKVQGPTGKKKKRRGGGGGGEVCPTSQRDPQKAAREVLPMAQKLCSPPRAIFTFRNWEGGRNSKLEETFQEFPP